MRKTWISILAAALVLCIGAVFMVTAPKPGQFSLSADEPIRGCTDILVGREASADGSVMTVHTADCGVCDWTWRLVPAADHPPGAVRRIHHIGQLATVSPEKGQKWDNIEDGFTGLELPQVSHTFAYFHGVFGYLNEHQLAMAESTIGCRSRLINPTPSALMDITTLTLLAMERCRTARQAIRLMGFLAETYGYGFHDEGEMLAVADPQEVWLFEIMPVGPLWTPGSGKPGAVWCAQRVPDDHIGFCPNESRIGEIDLENEDFFMASPNAVSLAVEMGFYDPGSGRPFNWKDAYSPADGSAVSSRGRRARLWRLFGLVAPSLGLDPGTPNKELPFSVRPDRKLSVADVMALTRDKYQGTRFDPAQGIRGGPFANPNAFQSFALDGKTYTAPRTVSVNAAEYTTVTQSRGWLPDPIGGLVWLSFGAQDTSCYMPLYSGITELPASFAVGDHWTFNRRSARWAFDYVDFHAQVAYVYAIRDIEKERHRWEDAALAMTSEVDARARKLHAGSPAEAAAFLTDYCLGNAESVVRAWWKLGDRLLVKYNHLRVYDPENRKRDSLPATDSWLRAVRDIDGLEPAPER